MMGRGLKRGAGCLLNRDPGQNAASWCMQGTSISSIWFRNWAKSATCGCHNSNFWKKKTKIITRLRGSWRIFSDASVVIVQWRRARDLTKLGHPQVPSSIPAETPSTQRQLKSIRIWENRLSSKGSKLLFPVINANTINCLCPLFQALFHCADSWRGWWPQHMMCRGLKRGAGCLLNLDHGQNAASLCMKGTSTSNTYHLTIRQTKNQKKKSQLQDHGVVYVAPLCEVCSRSDRQALQLH